MPKITQAKTNTPKRTFVDIIFTISLNFFPKIERFFANLLGINRFHTPNYSNLCLKVEISIITVSPALKGPVKVINHNLSYAFLLSSLIDKVWRLIVWLIFCRIFKISWKFHDGNQFSTFSLCNFNSLFFSQGWKKT